MEGLGKKLQDARLARNLTLDEAARMTKIRPKRLEEIENEDFSEFASLAYAKGFLLIYGKFLEVDVSPYLEAFETSESVTVDGYAYLQQDTAPPPRPSRQAVARQPSGGGGGGRGSFLPFVIGVVVLVVGLMIMKWIVEVQRLRPSPRQMVGVSPTATATGQERIIAPRAVPADNSANPTPAPAAPPTPVPAPTVVPQAPAPKMVPIEPEVRRAEPVHPEDVPAVVPTASPVVRRPLRAPTPTSGPRLSPVPRAVPAVPRP